MKKILLLLVLLGVQAGLANAKNIDDVVPQTTIIHGVPTEVMHGSIKVNEETPKAQLVARALISVEQAIAIAKKKSVGKVLSAKLEEEDGFLVWTIGMVIAPTVVIELRIDAGNGELLAAEQEGKDVWWNIWK